MLKVLQRYTSMFTAFMLALSIVVPATFLHNIPLTKAATYTVSNLNDSGAGSFRQAIIDSNSNAGSDTITVSASGTITLSSTMDAITGSVTIDGTAAPDFQVGPDIVLSATTSIDCLVFGSGGSGTVKSIAMATCRKGVQIQGGASNVTIGGTDFQGVAVNNSTTGISIEGASTVNVYNSLFGQVAANTTGIDITDGTTINIGGTTAPQGNTIGNSTGNGIQVGASTGVTIEGNFIGVDSSSGVPQGNLTNGILVNSASATNVVIGGNTSASRNYISANSSNGIKLSANGNAVTIKQNYVGVSSTGFAVGNLIDGINVATSSNSIGAVGAGNVIAGNGGAGITLTSSSATSNTINSNYIGLDGTGNTAVPNSGSGVTITQSAANNTVTNNYISSNGGAGIHVDSSATGTTYIYTNTIGLGVDGTTALGNTFQGIYADATIVVGDASDDTKRNTICSNGAAGIKINNGNALNSVIVNNAIGTTSASLDRGNAIGVEFANGATLATVGSETGTIQEINNNTNVGVLIDGSTTNFIKISKNNLINNAVLPISSINSANGTLASSTIGNITANTSGSSGTSTVASGEIFMLSGTGSNAAWVGTGVTAADLTWDIGVAISNSNNYWLYIIDPATNNTSPATATGVITADNTAPGEPTFTSSTGTTATASYTLTGAKDKYTSVYNANASIYAIDSATSWTSSTSLVEGVNTFTIATHDYSDNVSSTGTYTVTLDTIAPVVPVIVYSSTSSADKQTVTGTTEASAMVYVNDTYTTTADSAGAFTLVLSTPANSNTFNVNAKDSMSNTSAYSTIVISKASGSGTNSTSATSTSSTDQGQSMAGESEPTQTTQVTPSTTTSTTTTTTHTNTQNTNTRDSQTSASQTTTTVSPVTTVTAPAATTQPTKHNTYTNLYAPEETPQTNPEETAVAEPEKTFVAPSTAPVITAGILASSFMETSDSPDGIAKWWKEANFGSADVPVTGDLDSDEDGLPDSQEFLYGTNPKSNDSDYDGVPDMVEINEGGNPASYDTDGDGIADALENPGEIAIYNAPKLDEKVREQYIKENNIQLDTAVNQTLGQIDSDGDGLSDQQELVMGSDPTSTDSDSDGLSDGQEVLLYNTNPIKASKVAPVSISNVSKGQTNSAGKQYLMGATSTPNTDIEIVAIDKSGKEVVIATTQTDSNGFYSTLTSEVGEGTYTLTAVMKEGDKTLNISYPAELKVAKTVKAAPPQVKIEMSNNKPVIRGLVTSANTTIVAVWRSLVLTSTIVADQNFELTAPAGLEAGRHTATVYTVNNEDNSHSTPVQIEFTVSTTGFATGQTKGISPLITIGGSSLILLSLIALAIYRRRKNNENGQIRK